MTAGEEPPGVVKQPLIPKEILQLFGEVAHGIDKNQTGELHCLLVIHVSGSWALCCYVEIVPEARSRDLCARVVAPLLTRVT